jgi:hypothetical protein
MSAYSAENTGTHDHDRTAGRAVRRTTSETKPAFKTTELIAYVVVALGVLIASAVVDDKGAQGFGADHAWFYVTLLTVGYMVSRGIAKAGSYSKDDDPRTNS